MRIARTSAVRVSLAAESSHTTTITSRNLPSRFKKLPARTPKKSRRWRSLNLKKRNRREVVQRPRVWTSLKLKKQRVNKTRSGNPLTMEIWVANTTRMLKMSWRDSRVSRKTCSCLNKDSLLNKWTLKRKNRSLFMKRKAKKKRAQTGQSKKWEYLKLFYYLQLLTSHLNHSQWSKVTRTHSSL